MPFNFDHCPCLSKRSKILFKKIACSTASSEEKDSSKISTGSPLTPVTITQVEEVHYV